MQTKIALRAIAIALFLIISILVITIPKNASADSNCTWQPVSGNLASTDANWNTGIKPTYWDYVIFDGTSVTNCTWDISTIIVNGFSLNTGYTGTVTVTASFEINFNIVVTSLATLSITDSNYIRWDSYALDAFTNSGTIKGNGNLIVDTFNEDRTITFGNIESILTIHRHPNGGGINTIIKLGANTYLKNTLNIYSDAASKTVTLDTNSYSLKANNITIGIRGIIENDNQIECYGKWDSSDGAYSTINQRIIITNGTQIRSNTLIAFSFKNLSPNVIYQLSIDGNAANTFVSDSNGKINFTYLGDGMLRTLTLTTTPNDDIFASQASVALVVIIIGIIILFIGFGFVSKGKIA